MGIKLKGQEIKKIELDILKDVASFCDKNKIHYILIYGTLLGAIRHNGFIPWDDDVDIAIPRNEYETFIATYKNNRYQVMDYSINKNFEYAFGKVVDTRTLVEENTIRKGSFGVYIDVFPIETVPHGIEGKIQIYKSKILCRCSLYKLISSKYPTSSVHKLLHALIKVLLLPFPQRYIVREQIHCAKKHIGKSSDLRAVLTIGLGCQHIFPSDYFYDRKKVKFEDDYFFVFL